MIFGQQLEEYEARSGMCLIGDKRAEEMFIYDACKRAIVAHRAIEVATDN